MFRKRTRYSLTSNHKSNMHENFKKDTKSIDKFYIISKPEKEVGMIIRKTLLIQ